jgi:phenylalanyl-tRNA synthetase alpha subunit
LSTLRATYELAVSRATTPLLKAYISQLEKLKIEYTKAAKLQEALAVDSEIKKFKDTNNQGDKTNSQEDKSTSTTELPDTKSPAGERWTRQMGTTYDFHLDGTITITAKDHPIENGTRGLWKRMPDGSVEIHSKSILIGKLVILKKGEGLLTQQNHIDIKLTFDSMLK